MRWALSAFMVLIAVTLLLAAEPVAQPETTKPVLSQVDWKLFDDPTTVLLTHAFAESVNGLPVAEKASAINRLQGSLNSKDVEIRRRAALTLSDLGDKSGVPTMIDDLSTATGHDRAKVVVALRVMKDERAIPALRAALKDKSPYVRSIAVAALGELKATKAFDDIVALTKDKEFEGNTCIPNCPAESACYALGALGDERAIPVLISLLEDADLQGRARQALEVLTKPKRWKVYVWIIAACVGISILLLLSLRGRRWQGSAFMRSM